MRTRERFPRLRAALVAFAAAALVGAVPAQAQTETTEDTPSEPPPTTTDLPPEPEPTTDDLPPEPEPTTAEGGSAPPPTAADTTAQRRRLIRLIRRARRETWRWQRLMRVPLTPATRRAERSLSLPYQRWVLRHWRQKARTARWKAHHPRRLAAWMCIHRHEGPWTANTGNGYYGGLQMDVAFQRRYGLGLVRRKGLAHRWGYLEQIWVAERAYRSGRRFSPWPNTARACGLI